TDVLPASVTLVSASASQGSCNGTSTVNCSTGAIASGASATVTLVVRPTALGSLSNTVTVTENESDTNPTNNSATATNAVNDPMPPTISIFQINNGNSVTTSRDVTLALGASD